MNKRIMKSATGLQGNVSASEPATVTAPEVSAQPAEQPPVRQATDAEVDEAMEKIFQQHDHLFAELAK